MTLPAKVRFAQRLVALGLLVACAGPGLRRTVTITEGQPTTVRLISGNLALSLQNESAGHADKVYTAASADPSRKVTADADLQALLDVFSEQQMFERSMTVVPPGSLDTLMVEQGGRRWVWAVSADRRARLAAQQRGDRSEQTFHEARAYFLSLYNSSVAYHGTGTARPDFRGEGAR
ncbi:MAG: hypothetical protein WAT39_13855, partial [Planctomycetota bacterium]